MEQYEEKFKSMENKINDTPRLLQKKSTYIFDYDAAIKFTDEQNKVFWLWSEINLEKDIQDILVNFSDAEKHGVITVLKLFTHYELAVGNEYWGGRVKRTFKRPDIACMADCFSYFETNVHARFYNRINELLHLNTDEFYESYTKDDTLSERMKFIDAAVSDKDILYSLGVFSMVEGAILYASFAFLKHFQSQGKNKLRNLVAGIDFSVRDENLHHLGGAWLYRTLMAEMKLNTEQQKRITDRVIEAAKHLREHEHRIVDMIFEKGRIDGITPHQMKNFVDSRVDLCLQNLGISKIYDVQSNPIAEWFYTGISSSVMHDFFQNIGNQYHRDWKEEDFKW